MVVLGVNNHLIRVVGSAALNTVNLAKAGIDWLIVLSNSDDVFNRHLAWEL